MHKLLSKFVVSADGVKDGCALMVCLEMSAGEMRLVQGWGKRLFVRAVLFVLIFLNLGGRCFRVISFFGLLLRVGCSLEMTYFSYARGDSGLTATRFITQPAVCFLNCWWE